MSAPVRVYVLDDHAVVREGLAMVLEASGRVTVIGDSGSALEATRQIPALRPDVAVLDAHLPDGSGVEVCRDIRSVDPSLRAIILTSRRDDEALLAAVLAGADGYVGKDVCGHDLLSAVEQVAQGQPLLDPSLVARVRDRVRRRRQVAPQLRGLTAQELRLLRLVAQGLTNRQISQQMGLTEKTVKNYVSSMLHKLGLDSRTQAAVLATRLLPRTG